MKCLCTICKRNTNHLIISEKQESFVDEMGFWESITYQIIKCAGCDDISFRKELTDAAMQFAYGKHAIEEELYPKRTSLSRTSKTTNNLPKGLTEIYKETIDAFNNNQLILCSAGLRALIEGICLDKAIIGKEVTTKKGLNRISTSLASKIEALHLYKYLTEANCEALHKLRFLGNDALHELSKPPIDDLNVAIDIIELTLTNIYDIQSKTILLNRLSADGKEG